MTSHWPTVTLGKLLTLEYGTALKEDDRDTSGAIPVAGSNGVVGHHSRALVPGPGIVVGRKGSAGSVTWLDSDFWPIDTTYYVRWCVPCDAKWTYYLLRFLNLGTFATVTGVPGLNRNDVYRLQVHLPPPSEQRRIVEILDQADALRRKRAEADQKAERILPAIFHTMFGHVAASSRGWQVSPLSELAIDFRYGTSTRCHSEPNGLPVLRIPNVLGGEVDTSDLKYADLTHDEADRLMLEKGDLLIVRTNGNRDYVGRCAVFDQAEPHLFASYLIRIRLAPDRADPWFVAAYLQAPTGRAALSPFIRTTAGQSNISVEGLKQIPMLRPPIALQRRFRTHVIDSFRLRRATEQAGRALDTMFGSLLKRAFAGELTSRWRERHMKELLAEMELQAATIQALASAS